MHPIVLTLVEFATLALMWAALWITFGIVLGRVAIPWLVDRWCEIKGHWDEE